MTLNQDSAVPWKLRRKVFVLIGQYISSAQDEVLKAARNIRHIYKRTKILDQQMALVLIAPTARSDAIHPGILAAQFARQYVIPGQLMSGELLRAISASVPIAPEQ